ncbi:MAG: TadE/TadG family type IV pilus assembly protein, partial [Candidatus Promineifilaceae bacterium]
MNEQTQTNAEQHQRGQGLVEVALFLPLLIFLLAGVVEVSNLLITQNKVTTASRLAAGYGATNLDDEDRDLIVAGNWVSSTTALEMGEAATTAVTETLDLDPNLWDIWSIYA